MNKKLNPRQERFCLEYIATGNATQSAITAGYSPKTANNNIDKLMVNNGISQRIAELQAQIITTPDTATLQEKHQVLTDIIREPIKRPVTAKEKVMAIAESNRMTGDYAPEKHAVAHKVIFEVVYKEGKGATE